MGLAPGHAIFREDPRCSVAEVDFTLGSRKKPFAQVTGKFKRVSRGRKAGHSGMVCWLWFQCPKGAVIKLEKTMTVGSRLKAAARSGSRCTYTFHSTWHFHAFLCPQFFSNSFVSSLSVDVLSYDVTCLSCSKVFRS